MTKEEMLNEMGRHNWNTDALDKSDYEEVKVAYDEFCDEISDDSEMFPNGRDYGAEDEDGPC